MRLWKWIRKCPLLFLLVFCWLVFDVYALAKGRILDALKNEPLKNPVFAVLLEKKETPLPEIDVPDDVLEEFGTQTDDLQMADNDTDTQHAASDKTDTEKTDGTGKKTDTDDANTDTKDSVHEKKPDAGKTRYKKYKKKRTDSPYYSDPGKRALTTDYAYQKVKKSYFDDALFIGDSRTVGMQDYSGLENATFFAKTGLNVYEVLEDKFITEPKTGAQVNVAHMLKTHKYGKIYFMIGINELGTGNTQTFQKAYARVIRLFRKWQPDAVIYIQGIIAVSAAKSAEDAIFNNTNINDKNVAISELADGEHIFYLDINPVVTDKNGNLKADYTFDEIHMYAQYYKKWTHFLMKHAVVR